VSSGVPANERISVFEEPFTNNFSPTGETLRGPLTPPKFVI